MLGAIGARGNQPVGTGLFQCDGPTPRVCGRTAKPPKRFVAALGAAGLVVVCSLGVGLWRHEERFTSARAGPKLPRAVTGTEGIMDVSVSMEGGRWWVNGKRPWTGLGMRLLAWQSMAEESMAWHGMAWAGHRCHRGCSQHGGSGRRARSVTACQTRSRRCRRPRWGCGDWLLLTRKRRAWLARRIASIVGATHIRRLSLVEGGDGER